MANVAERDHEQVLEALAYDMVGKIGPVMDQGGNDLSRIGQEAQDVTDCPEDFRVMIIIEHAAMPSVAIGEGVGAVEVVKHREVCSGVHHV